MEIKPQNISSNNGRRITTLQDQPNLLFEFPVLDAIEAAKWDQYSIHEKNIDSRLLMGWAGYALFISISEKPWFINATHVHLLAGSGNNGGDGYVLAWHIISSTKKKVIIWQLSEPTTPDADYYFKLCSTGELSDQIEIKRLTDIHVNYNMFSNGDLVVDALFGIGLNKPPSDLLQNIFKQINSMNHVIRVAVDIPSGVFANGDFYAHTVFQAHYTYSFGSYKIGQLLEPGILGCGELTILPIGFFPYNFNMDSLQILAEANHRRILKSSEILSLRKQGGHKYDSGVLSILGGSVGMEGAAIMTARSFLSLGGGLAKIYSPTESMKKALADTPELMIQSYEDMSVMETAFLDSIKSHRKNNIAVVGVGLQETLSQNFWEQLLTFFETTIIVDGSGLGQLASYDHLFKKHQLKNLILTPHLAEAERLINKKITNARQAALEISNKYNAHVYLKGPGGILVLNKKMQDTLETNVESNRFVFEEIYIMSKHYELSTGGTGDVLCGIIANMLCRYHSAEGIEAALNVYFKAAEMAAQINFNQKDFLTPSEIIYALRKTIGNLNA